VFQHGIPIASLAEVAVDEPVESLRLIRNQGRVNRKFALFWAYDEAKQL
jgi:hypothetical protein